MLHRREISKRTQFELPIAQLPARSLPQTDAPHAPPPSASRAQNEPNWTPDGIPSSLLLTHDLSDSYGAESTSEARPPRPPASPRSPHRIRQIEPRRPAWRLLVPLLTAHLGLPLAADEGQPARSQPAALSFHARDLLDPNLIRGHGYTIDDQVPVRDDRYVFTLRTGEGPITAHGMPMLQVRLDEMESLRKARKLDEEPQEMEGIKESFKQTGRGFKSLIKDPGETLSNIPKGLGRKVKSITKGDKGGGSTRRQFAAAVGADPETDNPPLKKILDKLALRRSIGKGAVAVGGFFVTAGAANLAMVARGASALRTTADMNEAVRTQPLYKINEQISDDLAAMGVSEQQREAFIEHEAMTTVQRLLFMRQFKRLHQVSRSALLVRLALEMDDRPESLGLIHSMELLAQIHERRPLKEFLDSDWLLVRLADDSILCVSAADYLTDSPELDDDAAALRTRHGETPLTLLVAGKVAPAARGKLSAHKIRIIENAETAALAP